jgi:membrane-associated phospholipid phosphatase
MRLTKTGALLGLGLIATVLAAALLVGLAEVVWRGETEPFDAAVHRQLDAHMPGGKPFARVLSWVGSLDVLFVASLLVSAAFVLRRQYVAAVLLCLTMSGAFLIDLTMKATSERLRPNHLANTHGPMSYSFPSGHALGSLCFFGFLAAVLTRRRSVAWRVAAGAIAIVLVALIGASRIRLERHYASDVIAGFVAGALWLTIVLSAEWRWLSKKGPPEPSRDTSD